MALEITVSITIKKHQCQPLTWPVRRDGGQKSQTTVAGGRHRVSRNYPPRTITAAILRCGDWVRTMPTYFLEDLLLRGRRREACASEINKTARLKPCPVSEINHGKLQFDLFIPFGELFIADLQALPVYFGNGENISFTRL